MDIAKFESLLELPLTIKEVNSYGSWGGEGSDPAIFFSTEDKYVPIYQIKEAFEDIAFIYPEYYEYCKNKNQIHFEYFDGVYDDLPIVAFLSPESIRYLISNKINTR